MDSMSIYLIGLFEMTSRGNQYALTVICMLINYIMSIPLPDKSADTVVSAVFKGNML